jgi:hypothetical protein
MIRKVTRLLECGVDLPNDDIQYLRHHTGFRFSFKPTVKRNESQVPSPMTLIFRISKNYEILGLYQQPVTFHSWFVPAKVRTGC